MEDNLHVATCWHRGSRQVWKALLQDLCTWMEKQRTDPDLRFLVMDGLAQWRDRPHTARSYDEYGREDLRRSARAVQSRGWLTVLEGFLDPQWKVWQQDYYDDIGSRRTGQRWAVGLVKQFWNVLLKLWLHRNKSLHDSEAALKDVNGWPSLERAVRVEHARGRDILPAHFELFFTDDVDVILARPLDKVKRWYAVIKGGQENTGSDWSNEFSIKGSLRTWVGLYSPLNDSSSTSG